MSSVALATALCFAVVAQAGDGDRPPEWTAMQKRLAQDRVKMRFLLREEGSLLEGLRELERELEEKEGRAKALEKRVQRIEARLPELDRRIADNEGVIAGIRTVVGQRAAAMLRLRKTRLAELLRHAGAPAEARRLKDRLGLVLAHDAALVRKTREASTADRQLREELAVEREALGEAREALAAEVEEVRISREDRAALLEALRKERRAAERLANELAQAARRLEQELGTIRGRGPAPEPAPGGFGAQRGKLPWPVVGRVEATFGKKVDPESGMVLVQKGLDVRAPQGTPVRAVFGGKVAFTGWFDGFGRMAIVAHDGGHYSLYAHLESFTVAKGQEVAQHQVVGHLGDSGSTKGAFLYFELRAGKEPLDPLAWLVK